MNTGIEERIAEVRDRIAAACLRSARRAEDVTLVAVSKFVELQVVRAALEAGVRDFGESRPQELERKGSELRGARAGGTVRWHMIGPIQRNKARSVIEHADLIHSVDSVRLARALADRVPEGQTRDCLIQINISGEASKGGFSFTDATEAVREISDLDRVRICGLMGMAAYAENPEAVRPQFSRLRDLSQQIGSADIPGVLMRDLSMGMSNDYEVAVEEGATLVRVGTAIFGERPYL